MKKKKRGTKKRANTKVKRGTGKTGDRARLRRQATRDRALTSLKNATISHALEGKSERVISRALATCHRAGCADVDIRRAQETAAAEARRVPAPKTKAAARRR
jgi:hypothetical protein